MAKLLEEISGEEALKILRLLSAHDQDIENRIEELVENILKDVDLEEISEEVFFNLDNMDVHDLWDQSGARSDGEYISTEEMTYEMIENEILKDLFSIERGYLNGKTVTCLQRSNHNKLISLFERRTYYGKFHI
jgi:hypothetical protein